MKMLIYKISLILALVSIFLAGCYDDKGNYEYHDINRMTLKHSFFDSTLQMSSYADTLRIEPEVSGTMIDAPENYEYEWNIIRSFLEDANAQAQFLGNEKSLVYPIALPAGTYTVYCKVFDKTTKLTAFANFYLKLVTQFSSGWLVCGEGDEGMTQLDMVSIVGKDTTILKNILVNTHLDLGKPVRVQVPPLRFGALNNILLSTDKGTFQLYPDNLQPTEGSHLKWTFYNVNSAGKCVMTDFAQVMGYCRAMIIDGRFFYANIYGSQSCNLDLPTNHYSGSDELFPIGESLGTGLKENSQTIVLYNKTKGCFVSQSSGYQAYCSDLKDKTTDSFSWAPGPDYQFVTTINTRKDNGYTYTILKKDDEYYLYVYRISAYYGVIKQRMVKMENAVDLDKARFFGGSSLLSIIYYIVDNRLYGYDYLKDKCELLETYDGYEVTMLQHDILVQTTKDYFYVALYDPSKPASSGGIIKKYAVVDDVNNIIIKEETDSEWTNLCKVKNISYKYR